MEKILKSFESKAESFPLNKKIRRYPFNGTSKYLFDKFLLLGYDGQVKFSNGVFNPIGINDLSFLIYK